MAEDVRAEMVSTVYQVVWHNDIVNLTDVNMRSHKIIPGDQGSLIVAHRNLSLRLDQAVAEITGAQP